MTLKTQNLIIDPLVGYVLLNYMKSGLFSVFIRLVKMLTLLFWNSSSQSKRKQKKMEKEGTDGTNINGKMIDLTQTTNNHTKYK